MNKLNKKKTAIQLTLVLTALACFIFVEIRLSKEQEPIPIRTGKYDISDAEDYEYTDLVEYTDETPLVDESEAPLELNGDTEIQLPEEPEEEQQALPEQTDPIYEEPAAPRSMLLPNEKVVNDYDELKSALEGNNGINTIYLGNDITIRLGGISINTNKGQVIISGLNPFDAEQTEPHTLTDHSSATFANTIHIGSAGISTLVVRDMNIVGKNFYGSFSVLDVISTADVLVVYERVNYNGPQLVHHRRGTVQVKDCTIRIHGENGGSASQEFSEAKHLIFKGTNTIVSASSVYSIFWHPYGGTFTLDDDSSLSVLSPTTSTAYGVFFADLSTYHVDIDIGERANLDMTISGVVATNAYVSLSSLTVREGGKFHLTTTKAATANVLKIVGALNVEREASFIISGYGGASDSLLRQEGGNITVMKDAVFHLISQNEYSSLLNLVGRSFICDDPASILLFNAGRNIAATTQSAEIYINAQQVNYWNTLSGESLDTPATNRWDKPDGSNIMVNGTLSTGTNGNFSSIQSNYTPGDLPGKAPDASTLSMKDARILAFGRLELTIVQPTTKSTAINGVTRPGTKVRVSFTQSDENYILPDVTTDSAGVFHVPVGVVLEKDTVIKVQCSWQFLTNTAEAVVLDGGGKLEIFVPDHIEFPVTKLSSSSKIIKRLHPGWEIIVSDGRSAVNGWSLYARLGSEMTPDKVGLPAIVGALVYVDSSGVETVMSTDEDVFIASQTSALEKEVVPITWDENKGILLFVKPGSAFTDTTYTAQIIWTLIDAP